jgi:hypothetical protein
MILTGRLGQAWAQAAVAASNTVATPQRRSLVHENNVMLIS